MVKCMRVAGLVVATGQNAEGLALCMCILQGKRTQDVALRMHVSTDACYRLLGGSFKELWVTGSSSVRRNDAGQAHPGRGAAHACCSPCAARPTRPSARHTRLGGLCAAALRGHSRAQAAHRERPAGKGAPALSLCCMFHSMCPSEHIACKGVVSWSHPSWRHARETLLVRKWHAPPGLTVPSGAALFLESHAGECRLLLWSGSEDLDPGVLA
jgi:hypothetical protein